MDPLLATSLVNIGEKLITRIAGLDTPASHASKVAFESLMPAPVQAGSDVQTFLQAQGVRDFEGLEVLERQMVQALRKHPDLASQLAKVPEGMPLTLKLTDGQMLSIEGPEGEVATIAKDGEAGQLAYRLHQVKSMMDAHRQFPGSAFTQVLDQIQQQPVLNARWSLTALNTLAS